MHVHFFKENLDHLSVQNLRKTIYIKNDYNLHWYIDNITPMGELLTCQP